jgi:hypothetical protein
MEKEEIKKGLRALYPKVAEELIEAAATYPGNSQVDIFIRRIIARAATYGMAKEQIGDVCPVGHELNRMLGGLVKVQKPKQAFDKIDAITFDEWKARRKRGGAFDPMEEWLNGFDVAEMINWRPTGELRIEKMLKDFSQAYPKETLTGFHNEITESDKIARLMHSMKDPRLSGRERDIWIVSSDKEGLKVWQGRYSECHGPLYMEGGKRIGDWVGWMEKEDYTPPKNQSDGQ